MIKNIIIFIITVNITADFILRQSFERYLFLELIV